MSRKHRMGAVELASQLRRARQRQPVTIVRAEPAAWREALRLASGDPRRLQIRGDGSVIVR